MEFINIQHPIRWLLLLHIICGAVALAVFLIPLLTKKGGKLHIKIGWLYTFAMVLVGLTSLIITPWRMFLDVARNSATTGFSAFLFFVAAFTLCSIWNGLRVMKFKSRMTSDTGLLQIGPSILLIVLGIAIQILGYSTQNMLLMIFPFLSHLSSADQLRYWLSAPKEKMHWWFFHMNGMFAACIATVTAFLVTAVPRILPGSSTAHSPLLWVAPGLILGLVSRRWTKSYRSQFEKYSS